MKEMKIVNPKTKKEISITYNSDEILSVDEKEIKTCGDCKHFQSYRDAYFDDLEPDTEGFCRGNKDKDYTTINSAICENFD